MHDLPIFNSQLIPWPLEVNIKTAKVVRNQLTENDVSNLLVSLSFAKAQKMSDLCGIKAELNWNWSCEPLTDIYGSNEMKMMDSFCWRIFE